MCLKLENAPVLNRLITKSEAAFRLSMQMLSEESTHLYFWTITWLEVWPYNFYGNTFTRFYQQLQKKYGQEIPGVRVFEANKRGGLHVHLVVQCRIAADFFRQVGKESGIGRCNVKHVTYRQGKTDYLAKYLSKKRVMPGLRKWACIGGFRGAQVGNILVDSVEANAIRSATQGKQLPFREIQAIAYDIRQQLYFDRQSVTSRYAQTCQQTRSPLLPCTETM